MPAVNERITALIRAEGADAWFTRPDADFLGDHDAGRFEKIEDILDVWFDSGSTHAFVLEGRADTRWPADLYLEGSDQHRGWFQSSLLESSGTRGRAPYDAILTHGFVMAEDGEKMSKSLGNAVEPEDVIRQSGAEILRLWVAARRLRRGQPDRADDPADDDRQLPQAAGTRCATSLAPFAGFAEDERVALADMPPLERFILHRLWALDRRVREAYEGYRFYDVARPLADFCTNDLSALYFDIRRDVLYCDRPDSLRRRACRTVMDLVFERLTAWLAPILAFTMEEAWSTRFPDAGPNAMRVIPATPDAWRNDAEAERWGKVEAVIRVVTGALEIERRDKRIGAALEAAPRVWIADPGLLAAFEGLDAAEVFRTSQASLIAGEGPADAFRSPEAPGVAVAPLRAEGRKCARSWRVLPEVGQDPRYPDLSLRDADAVAFWDAAHGR